MKKEDVAVLQIQFCHLQSLDYIQNKNLQLGTRVTDKQEKKG